MYKFEDIISGDFSKYDEETQTYMKIYTEKIREKIKVELINHIVSEMLENAEKNKENFINTLSEILENGYKGLNKMPTGALLNMYLERKNQEEFINLLEKINDEII
ncbi:hypothetical protein SAMN02745163_00429 [Clostridium cavendishii DSM 21758]|uniref:Uncharacterized protein n=1 Tax=Clostridium cavendishii DSM 21758 TaxID=1121302 RepID=A0A1M6CBU7_9CLOT|nr:hypothetical protein [Clostridium cavendishii]SHI58510.1 hypothetical protein SAMN02745163_00429 [Clostridium cavendishii DSM 21758]